LCFGIAAQKLVVESHIQKRTMDLHPEICADVKQEGRTRGAIVQYSA